MPSTLRRILFAVLLSLVGTVPLVMTLPEKTHYDVQLYQRVGDDVAAGVMPYRDRVLEYPPYAIPYFYLPKALGAEDYGRGFKLLALATDAVIKALLLWAGWKRARDAEALLPLAVYCAAIPFLSYFFLQRYDLFPSLVGLASVLLYAAGRRGLAGAAVVVGAGVKLYPALFFPPLFVRAWRDGSWKRFLAGSFLGVLPLVAASFFMPWWNFLAYHNERGLQVESIYASLLWLAHFPGWIQAVWSEGHGCHEVSGDVAAAVLPWARIAFAATVLASTAVACRAASRLKDASAPELARLMLLPLLAFVAFNQVFSPQFLIWILPLAGVAALDGRHRITALLFLSAALTRLFFPTDVYWKGLTLFETGSLVLRNLALIAAWFFSLKAAISSRRDI